MATVLFSGMGFAQTMSTAQQNKLVSSQMVALVNVTKTFYRAGQSYDGFLAALMVPSPTFPSQDALFKKVYSYVSNNTADCDIINADNSVLTQCVNDLSKSPKHQSTYAKAQNPPKKWWQIAINWVINTVGGIILSNNGITPPPPVDIFPGN